MSGSVTHRRRWREYILSIPARCTAAALAIAQDVRDAAEPPTLTGALKASVHIETLDQTEASDAERRARARRPKARFGRLRRPTRKGVAYIGWRVEYGVFVERRRPWVRAALRKAQSAARGGRLRRVWREAVRL